VQRYKGIEIFRAVSNFSIKMVKLLCSKRIVDGISKAKYNETLVTSIDALTEAYVLGIKANESFHCLENIETNKFKISNGFIEEPVVPI
jgi:aspartate ammonia-lyase